MLRQLQSLDAELQVPLFTPVHESVRQALVRHAPAACLNNRERNETGLDALGEDDYAGSLWRSPAGSSYMFDGNAFTCIAVHAAAFQAWVGRCAVRNVCLVGADGTGEQAFRAHDNPDKVTWVRIRLRFQSERVVKYFPEVASSFELTNGAVEVYTRVHHTHSGASQH